jgi:hypothetical protein
MLRNSYDWASQENHIPVEVISFIFIYGAGMEPSPLFQYSSSKKTGNFHRRQILYSCGFLVTNSKCSGGVSITGETNSLTMTPLKGIFKREQYTLLETQLSGKWKS